MLPNRVAALGAAATAVAGGVAAALGAIDSPSKAVVASVALVVVGAVAAVYLLGWQKHEARRATINVPSITTSSGTAGASAYVVGANNWNMTPMSPDVAVKPDPELDDPEYPDAPSIPTLEQHSHLQDPA